MPGQTQTVISPNQLAASIGLLLFVLLMMGQPGTSPFWVQGDMAQQSAQVDTFCDDDPQVPTCSVSFKQELVAYYSDQPTFLLVFKRALTSLPDSRASPFLFSV